MQEKNWKYKAYPQDQVEKLAKRVRSAWLAHKDETGITQTEFAESLGITQPALNQFLNGVTPISNAMIIQICSKLGTTPQDMVKGIKFFEPFFSELITSKKVRIRYKVGAKKYKEITVTGEAVHYHVDVRSDVDVYAVEIADATYEPRYFKGEKLIVAAVEPQEGDEAFAKLHDGNTSIIRLLPEGRVSCMKNVGNCFDTESVVYAEHEHKIEFLHKVVGMSK